MAGKSPGKDLEKVMSSTFRAPLSETESDEAPSLMDRAKSWLSPAAPDAAKSKKNM